MKILPVLILAFTCSVWGNPSSFRRISLDSLKEYSNIRLQTSGNLISEDGLYCADLLLEKTESAENKPENPFSKFKCGHLEVTEFTFRGYRDEYLELLYKPDGASEAYFGKAKIRKGEVLNCYLSVHNEAELHVMSEKQFEKISKASTVTIIAVVAVGAILISLLALAAGLAASPIK